MVKNGKIQMTAKTGLKPIKTHSLETYEFASFSL